MIKAVVIDLDDTLFLTQQVAFDMENESLRRMGRSTMSRMIHQQTWGRPLSEAIATRSPGIDVEQFRRHFSLVVTDYAQKGKVDAITPENLAALDALTKHDKQLFILTSRAHIEVAHLLEPHHVLARRITTFYYRDNMQFHKPDPRAFDALLREYRLRAEECVYIGDSISDAEAAKGAKLHFIANLESGLRTKEDFNDYAVDAFVMQFQDCANAVQLLDHKVKLTN